jgi:adenylate kinase
VPQVESLDRFLETRGERADAAIYIDVPQPVLVTRLLGRGRKDDTREAIETRLQIYEDQTEPLLSLYQRRGLLHRVNGDRPVEAVTEDIVAILSALFVDGAH